jgi:hypothetical protein
MIVTNLGSSPSQRLTSQLQKKEKIVNPTVKVTLFSRRVWTLILLAVVAVAGIGTWRAAAQEGQGEAGGIIGSWSVTASVSTLQGVPPFPVLMTFHADGTMSQSRLYYLPAFGVLSTSFHGAWNRVKGNQIATTSLSLAQGAPGNAALNGAFFGTETVNFRPVLSADGNSFTAQWTSTVVDPSGHQIMQNGGTLSGVRIQVEP